MDKRDCFKLDDNLLSFLRPHQIEAVDFLLKRLLIDKIQEYHSDDSSTSLPITGGILADDMGTGKTLVSLATAWTICRVQRCKGIIVCPATLVKNWEDEVHKWLSYCGGQKRVLFVHSSLSKNATDAVVNTFIVSHTSIHPLLVLCYEMFRPFAAAFNTMNNLELLICDEGHRLKNAYGTKTSLALGNCCALRRLVVTGTPVQNNLEELYSVVNFVAPNYLGDLREFKLDFQMKGNYVTVVEKAELVSATDSDKLQAGICMDRLRDLLAPMLLRRSRVEILQRILPPRIEFEVKFLMAPIQKEQYSCQAHALIIPPPIPSFHAYDSLDSCSTDDAATVGTKRKILPVIGNSENTVKSSLLVVLPALTSLRLLCNIASVSSSSSSTIASSVSDPCEVERIANSFLTNSAKLQFLDNLLGQIFRVTKPVEKVVVVSNFTSSLDHIQTLLRFRRWKFLRLDGNVTDADRRMRIVNHFNAESSPFFVMLLSAKAGGVGLNLIGGNRLVLFEPDWNPATDAQCMARIWREGQSKTCFIYRLVCANTIEESIMKRQRQKNVLASLVECVDPVTVTSSTSNELRKSLDMIDQDIEVVETIEASGVSLRGNKHSILESLVFPHGKVTFLDTTSISGADLDLKENEVTDDEILRAILRTCNVVTDIIRA